MVFDPSKLEEAAKRRAASVKTAAAQSSNQSIESVVNGSIPEDPAVNMSVAGGATQAGSQDGANPGGGLAPTPTGTPDVNPLIDGLTPNVTPAPAPARALEERLMPPHSMRVHLKAWGIDPVAEYYNQPRERRLDLAEDPAARAQFWADLDALATERETDARKTDVRAKYEAFVKRVREAEAARKASTRFCSLCNESVQGEVGGRPEGCIYQVSVVFDSVVMLEEIKAAMDASPEMDASAFERLPQVVKLLRRIYWLTTGRKIGMLNVTCTRSDGWTIVVPNPHLQKVQGYHFLGINSEDEKA